MSPTPPPPPITSTIPAEPLNADGWIRWTRLRPVEPGALTASPEPGQAAVDRDTLADLTGLHPNRIATSSLCGLAIPTDHAGGREQHWRNINPEALWLPFLWFGPWADPATIVGPNGQDRAETIDEWLMRLAVLAEHLGVFDPATGAFLDQLAAVGIDVDEPADIARIEAWQRGEPDPILDTLAFTDADLDGTDADGMANLAQLHVVWQTHARDARDAATGAGLFVELAAPVEGHDTGEHVELALAALTAALNLDGDLAPITAVAAEEITEWADGVRTDVAGLTAVIGASVAWASTGRHLSDLAAWHTAEAESIRGQLTDLRRAA